MPNPTIGNESQFTPSYSWGGGFSSFDIATQQETLIVGKNPTLDAKRSRYVVEYDLSGKLITNKNETVSQFQSYGKKFIQDIDTITEYDGYGFTPAGTDGYLIKISSTQQSRVINENVNSLTMAGTKNSNKELGFKDLTKTGITAAVGTMGIPAVAPQINTLFEGAGLLDPTYATVPLQNLNNKIAGGFPVRYIDFRTKKVSLKGKEFSEVTGVAVQKRIDGASAILRSDSPGFVSSYSALSATVGGPYVLWNLDTMFGWGQHDSPTAMRNDFTLRSNIASKWNKTKLKQIEKGNGRKLKHALEKTTNILETLTPFRGDRVNVIDFSTRKWDEIYRWLPGNASDSNFEDAYDKLTNVLGANPYGTTKDFIKFFFTGPKLHAGAKDDADDVIVFRAILTSFSDQFSPSWNPVNLLGRADSSYHYGGYARSVDLGFTVYATDRDELKYIYRKLNGLAGYTAPEYNTDSFAMKGPWIRATIGDYFVSQPALIDSLSYTFVDSDTTWEINLENDRDMMQVTHKIDVSMGLTMITSYLPEKGGSMYTLAKEIQKDGRPQPGQVGSWLADSKTMISPEKRGIKTSIDPPTQNSTQNPENQKLNN